MRDAKTTATLSEIKAASAGREYPSLVMIGGVTGPMAETLMFEGSELAKYEYNLPAHEAWAIEEFKYDHRRPEWEALRARRATAQEASAA